MAVFVNLSRCQHPLGSGLVSDFGRAVIWVTRGHFTVAENTRTAVSAPTDIVCTVSLPLQESDGSNH